MAELDSLNRQKQSKVPLKFTKSDADRVETPATGKHFSCYMELTIRIVMMAPLIFNALY